METKATRPVLAAFRARGGSDDFFVMSAHDGLDYPCRSASDGIQSHSDAVALAEEAACLPGMDGRLRLAFKP